MNAYPVTLNFTRHFTSGTLVGIDHNDTLGFVSVDAARRWVRCVSASNAEGGCDYKVTAYAMTFADN